MGLIYEARVQEALRGVVRDVLKQVAKDGLPDPHHFYISLRTSYPGVVFPESVRRAHPKEVTVVLQHQFWDLKVNDTGFSVVLTFQDTPHTIYVPFKAMLSFMDPGVRFGLHFTPPPIDIDEVPAKPTTVVDADVKKKSAAKPKAPKVDNVIRMDQFRKK